MSTWADHSDPEHDQTETVRAPIKILHRETLAVIPADMRIAEMMRTGFYFCSACRGGGHNQTIEKGNVCERCGRTPLKFCPPV